MNGYPSIRGKALSRRKCPVKCRSTAWFAREVEDQDSGNLTLNHLRWKVVPPTIDTARTSTMILLCEHPAAGPVRKWKTPFCFPRRAFCAVFCTGPFRDARAPNQSIGLACADQGHPRAALDANDLRIRGVGAQHPVESYCQLARRRHLGHAFRHAMAALLIRLAKTFIHPIGAVRRFHQQHAHKPVPLFADGSQSLPSARTALARNQPQIAGHLLASPKTRDVAEGHHER